MWILLASEYSLGDIALFFVVDLFEEWEFMLELIIFDSILLQARVSIASGLTFESYCNSNIRNYLQTIFYGIRIGKSILYLNGQYHGIAFQRHYSC